MFTLPIIASIVISGIILAIIIVPRKEINSGKREVRKIPSMGVVITIIVLLVWALYESLASTEIDILVEYSFPIVVSVITIGVIIKISIMNKTEFDKLRHIIFKVFDRLLLVITAIVVVIILLAVGIYLDKHPRDNAIETKQSSEPSRPNNKLAAAYKTVRKSKDPREVKRALLTINVEYHKLIRDCKIETCHLINKEIARVLRDTVEHIHEMGGKTENRYMLRDWDQCVELCLMIQQAIIDEDYRLKDGQEYREYLKELEKL